MLPGENNIAPVGQEGPLFSDNPTTTLDSPLSSLPRPKFPQVGRIPETPFDVLFQPRVLLASGTTFSLDMYRYSVRIDGTLFNLNSYFRVYVLNGSIVGFVDSDSGDPGPENFPGDAPNYEYLPLGG